MMSTQESEWRYQKLLEQSGGDPSSVRSARRHDRKVSGGSHDKDDDDKGKLAMFEPQRAPLLDVLGDGQKPFYCEKEYGTQKEKPGAVRRALKQESVLADPASEADVRRVVAQQRAKRDEKRKQRQDPMLKVAQTLGDYSFLQPHPKDVSDPASMNARSQSRDQQSLSSKEPATKRSRRSHSSHAHSHHHHKHDHRHHHHHHHHHHSSDDSDSDDYSDDDDDELRRLRAERLQREQRERIRTEQYLQRTLSSTSTSTPTASLTSHHLRP